MHKIEVLNAFRHPIWSHRTVPNLPILRIFMAPNTCTFLVTPRNAATPSLVTVSPTAISMSSVGYTISCTPKAAISNFPYCSCTLSRRWYG